MADIPHPPQGARGLLSAVTPRPPLRIAVIRFTGTSICRASSAADMPSSSNSTALRLGHWFGTTPEFRLNLQTLYELRPARREVGDRVNKLPTLPRHKRESAPNRV
jgi:hypothetical protein